MNNTVHIEKYKFTKHFKQCYQKHDVKNNNKKHLTIFKALYIAKHTKNTKEIMIPQSKMKILPKIYILKIHTITVNFARLQQIKTNKLKEGKREKTEYYQYENLKSVYEDISRTKCLNNLTSLESIDYLYKD